MTPSRRTTRQRVAILAEHFPPAILGGGPAQSLGAMVRQSRHPEDVLVLTPDTEHTRTRPMDVPREQWVDYHGAHVWYGATRSLWDVLRLLRVARAARPTYVYINSVFSWRFSILPLVLARIGYWRQAPVIVAPRGELDPGALALKGRKKFAYLRLARLLGLFSHVLWHASGPREARAIADRSPVRDPQILIKENESGLPLRATPPRPSGEETLRLVCPGRVSRKKRIELVLQALQSPELKGRFTLTVAGVADDHSYLTELKECAAPISDLVTWTGPLTRDRMLSILSEHDAACFPTAGENFGHAIGEALSRSLPVLIADVTPWTEVVSDGGGVIVEETDVDGWVAALQELSGRTPSRAARAALAGTSYERWRSSVDTTSFLDYLLEGTFEQLSAGR